MVTEKAQALGEAQQALGEAQAVAAVGSVRGDSRRQIAKRGHSRRQIAKRGRSRRLAKKVAGVYKKRSRANRRRLARG